MKYFVDGFISIFPSKIGQKVINTEISYEESLVWLKMDMQDLEDKSILEHGDIVFNRVFDKDVARWFIIRIQ